MVEVAARLGGGHDAELCRAATGVDLNDLALSFALGEQIACKCTVRHERWRPARSAGRASSSSSRRRACCARRSGIEEAEAVEGVEWVRTYRQPGWRFGPLRRGADRAGAILATGRRPRRRRWRGLAVRRRPYASWSMRPPRSTRLGFQPPAIGEEEIAAVVETLRSGWLTTGPRAALLEERMAAYLEAEHVLAVTSGTAALHLALLALGVGPGRRGDHEPDHLARDRQRDRALRRHARSSATSARATSTSTRR